MCNMLLHNNKQGILNSWKKSERSLLKVIRMPNGSSNKIVNYTDAEVLELRADAVRSGFSNGNLRTIIKTD